MSPVMTARSPSDSIITLTWPGVWPMEGVSRTSGEITWSISTTSTRPALKIGLILSPSIACCSSSSTVLMNSYSRRPMR